MISHNSTFRVNGAVGARPVRRVLLFNHTAVQSGGEIAMCNLAAHLDTRRYRPLVVVGRDGPLVERLRSSGVETRIVPLAPGLVDTRRESIGLRTLLNVGEAGRAAGHVWRLRNLIRVLGIDLVHTNSLKSNVIGAAAARLAGVPVVWHVRDRISADYLKPSVATGYRGLCVAVPDAVITNSHATRRSLLPDGQADTAFARRVHAVHEGVDDVPTQRPPRPTGRARPRIGLVGRLSPWKGQDVFIRAAARLMAAGYDADFQIIGGALFGEEAHAEALRALVRRLGVTDRVEFTGFRSDARRLIGELDLLVHASVIAEPFGQVIVEAMASGVPVVATRGGGVPEIVTDGQNGLLVPMGDEHAMAAAVARLLDAPEFAETLARAGHACVAERFTIARTARGVMEVYDDLCGRRSPAAFRLRGQPCISTP